MLYALGFVFMFTIGGLKNHLALLLKTTICWKLLTIMLLEFYLISVTTYNFEQSAGNQQILFLVLLLMLWEKALNNYTKNTLVGTSETKCSPFFIKNEDIVRVIKHSLINIIHARTLNFIATNPYSSIIPTSNTEDNIINLKAIKTYSSLTQDKAQILKDEKDKSGIYCFINNINGHAYIGSSINLASRMKNYLNNTFLKTRQNSNMPIVKALLKYGQLNLSLLILEYVKPESLAIRETFYITSLTPYYNVLKQGYSSTGYKHTQETKRLLSELAKNRIHSDKTKALIAKALTGENNPFYNKNHSIESKIRMIEANSAYPVYVYNSFKELLVIFPSVKTLAKLIKSNHPTLINVIKQQIIFRGEWYLNNIPYNLTDTPLILDWYSEQSNKLILEISNCSEIKKAIFAYNTDGSFLGKYQGVMAAERAFKISHSTIKNYAKIGGRYSGYIFSYERLNN